MNKITFIAIGLFFGFFLNQYWDFPYKEGVKFLFKSQYGEHVHQCDNAMREHFLAKSKTSSSPSEQTLRELENTEVALLDCHDYDKFRKKLINFGLNENDLAEMGLQAIEQTRTNLQTIVGQHEICY